MPPETPPGKGTGTISQTGGNLKQAEVISGKNWHLGVTFMAVWKEMVGM